jgi:chemotaxis protein MotA
MKRALDLGTIGGLALGLLAIFGSFLLEGGQIGALILGPAMIIVFGGTIATAMIGNPIARVLTIGTLIKMAALPPVYDSKGMINTIVRLATVARKDGLLALEKELDRIENPFLKKLLRFAIDGTEPDVLKSLAETEVHHVGRRHAENAALFQKMGGYSPTMGIIGTVMGLIATLAAAGDDPNALIHHIAGAFIATLWGVFMANVVWLPLADKLKAIDQDEGVYLEMITEGIIDLQAGEVPSVVRAKLNSMLPASQQEAIR